MLKVLNYKKLRKIILLCMIFVFILNFCNGIVFVSAIGNVEEVVVCQAGYSSKDYKIAFVLATEELDDTTYHIYRGTTLVSTGIMKEEGKSLLHKKVYSIDFTGYETIGDNYTIKSNGVSSYAFSIVDNMWDGYKDEMTAFYRLLRTTDTTVSYPTGYSSITPSQKIFHPDSYLDDAQDKDTGVRYDFTGGWFDAGDYGKYGGNQWVQANIAITYIRNSGFLGIDFDNDNNGIPDLIDEAVYGSEYLIKFANQTGGAVYSIKNYTSFQHPEKATDNIPGTEDDPFFILSTSTGLSEVQTGGSAKAAASLAATARAINIALSNNKISLDKISAMESFENECEDAALICYQYANNHQNDTEGSYSSIGGIENPLLLAEVELYLLTNDDNYKTVAASRIEELTTSDIRCTNYWDLRPLAMAEFYNVADAITQSKIHSLLKYEVDYFLSSANDTPYGVLDEFGNFGVNEAHVSYLADALRYYELFRDPSVLKAVEKGMYWLFGNNPYNISWVSGIGTNYVNYLHTRLDEEVKNTNNTGIVLPGALVSGANIKDPMDKASESPWYQDRPFYKDDTNQWRYNEFSISIQAGFFYTMFGLANMNGESTKEAMETAKLYITSPSIGDYVTGDVTLFTNAESELSDMSFSTTRDFTSDIDMTETDGIYKGNYNVDSDTAYTNKRIYIRGLSDDNSYIYSAAHFTVAPSLPDPTHPLLYDDFNDDGTWGVQKLGWANWYNQNGGSGTYTKILDGERNVGKFTQTSAALNSYAKFEPWHDTVDLSGYRFINFTMRNPGYENSRIKIEVNDGSKTYQLSGGYLNVPSEWTTYSFDLNSFPAITDKSNIHFNIWMNQTVIGYGEMLIDEITASNVEDGFAPILNNTSISATEGDNLTPFTFTVTYTDEDNQQPFAVQLIVDGVIKNMSEADLSDIAYTDGKVYTYTTTLSPGIHSYYFRTTDTNSNVVSTNPVTGPTVAISEVTYETEQLVLNAISGGDTRMRISDTLARGSVLDKLNDNAVNDYIEYKVNFPQSGTYEVVLKIRKSSDSGIAQLSIDGINQGVEFDGYAPSNSYEVINLGNITITKGGDKLFRLQMTEKNSLSKGYKLFTDYIKLTRQ